MFSLTVIFGSVAWMLLFREKEKAEAAVRALMLPKPTGFGSEIPTPITDDFQQSVYCTSAPTAIMFEELDISRMVHVEHMVRQHRIQFDAKTRVENDVGMRMRNGPAIMTPNFPRQ
jgi:hypothetical protein